MAKKSKHKKSKQKEKPPVQPANTAQNKTQNTGKIKELLFDFNENKFIELNEHGDPIPLGDDDFVGVQESLKKLKERENAILSEEKSSEKQEELKDQVLSRELLNKNAEIASAKLKETRENLAKAGEKAKDSMKQMSEKAKPLAKATGKSFQKGFSSMQGSLGKMAGSAQKSIREGGLKRFVKENMITMIIAFVVVVVGGGFYWSSYKKLPMLSETHAQNKGNDYRSYDADAHPMNILSAVREGMEDFKGAPSSKGDGKTPETKYVIYSLNWFGMPRKTILFYNNNQQFIKIKLEIGNESAKSIYDKLKKELGTPLEDQDPTVKGGYAIWIKDAIRYKMLHRGTYSTIEMTLATYDNPSALNVGKSPYTIQYLKDIDLNGDNVLDEKILLLGNKGEGITTNFSKIYLLVWDGKKTYLRSMAEEFDGGSFPQIEFKDINGDKKEEIMISAENNIVTNYNVFEYTGEDMKLIYSGYEEPTKTEAAQDKTQTDQKAEKNE